MLAFCSLLFFIFSSNVYGYYRNDNNYDRYNYDNYYSGQYYISPLMTSTTPIPYNYYDSSINNWPYNYPPNYYLAGGNYSYYNYGYNTLSVSCYTNNSYVNTNQPVNWVARVSGGYNRNFFYNWSGTDNPLSLNSSSINVTYQSPGVKTMSVTVSDSFGQTGTAYCGSSVVNQSYYYYPYYPVPSYW